MSNYQNEIMKNINQAQKYVQDWLDRSNYRSFHNAIASRVVGQPDLALITTAIWAHLKNIASGGKYPAPNIILSAPSGCGKTETFRALRDYFQKEMSFLPVTQVDMNMITNEGFKGADSITIVEALMSGSPSLGGVGIIFLDEFDKRIAPCYASSGENINKGIQSQILTLIEGRIFDTSRGGPHPIDTTYTLFIASGSFDEVRRQRESAQTAPTHKTLGFGAVQETKEHTPSYFDPITKEDIIKFGGIHELIGRFSIVATYHPIPANSLDPVITRCAKDVASQFGLTKVQMSAAYKAKLRELASSKEGIRAISSAITQEVLPILARALQAGADTNGDLSVLLIAPGKGRYNISRPSNPLLKNLAS